MRASEPNAVAQGVSIDGEEAPGPSEESSLSLQEEQEERTKGTVRKSMVLQTPSEGTFSEERVTSCVQCH